jgi:hypothetical protein
MWTEKATMSAQQVVDYLTEKLGAERLLDFVVEKRVLEFPDEFLAEVVLNDGTKLEEARSLADAVQGEFRAKGVELDSIVRAQWHVDAVKKVAGHELPGLPAGPVGLLFQCALRSGGRTQDVWVDVTSSAFQALRPLGTSDEALENSVRDFLRRRLSVGGPGYWDPIRDSRLELDARAAQYLRWRPYQQLRGAIDRALRSLEDARRFLGCFRLTGKKATGNFNHVLEELAGPSGAIARGEQVPTSNYQLYELLLDTEKKDLEVYYLQKLERARKEWPELKREFPEVLPK